MKKIKLFGDLEQFRAEWELYVKTVPEALRAIECNRPGFLASADAGDYALILVDQNDGKLTRQVTTLNALDSWGEETLVVVPRVSGETGLEIGAAVAAAIGAVGTTAAIVAAIVDIAISIAISLAISTVAQLISGTNDGTNASQLERYDSRPSYLFNGIVNTTRQGHRVPLLYGGPMLVGSMVLSARVHVKDIKI